MKTNLFHITKSTQNYVGDYWKKQFLNLAEISDRYNMSRQSVCDIQRRVEDTIFATGSINLFFVGCTVDKSCSKYLYYSCLQFTAFQYNTVVKPGEQVS